MRTIKHIFFFLILAATILVSCQDETRMKQAVRSRIFPGYHLLLDEIIRSPEGVFRGINLNTPSGLIKQMEVISPTEDTEDHLYYEFQSDSLINYTVDYAFNKDSLEEISVQIYTSDLDLSSYLFCDLKDYYANKLPNPREDKGYVVYNCFEGQRKPFVVSLSDNSSLSRGIITMVIYKDN